MKKMSDYLISEMFKERTKNSIKNIVSPNQNLTFTDLKIYYKKKDFDVGSNFEKQLNFFYL